MISRVLLSAPAHSSGLADPQALGTNRQHHQAGEREKDGIPPLLARPDIDQRHAASHEHVMRSDSPGPARCADHTRRVHSMHGPSQREENGIDLQQQKRDKTQNPPRRSEAADVKVSAPTSEDRLEALVHPDSRPSITEAQPWFKTSGLELPREGHVFA